MNIRTLSNFINDSCNDKCRKCAGNFNNYKSSKSYKVSVLHADNEIINDIIITYSCLYIKLNLAIVANNMMSMLLKTRK